MARIFLSHSSNDDAKAVALRDWLLGQGWDDVFLDLDPRRGIAAGERWERALHQAALRCEVVLFLVSKRWLASDWCQKEFVLAHRLNKRLFGVLIEDIPVADLPAMLTGSWQLVSLASGRDHVMIRAVSPGAQNEEHVTFSRDGLTRLRLGLERAGLDPLFFAWPPDDDPKRPPYRGLLPLEAEDAGIFFGREAPIIEALDCIRGMREGIAPRFLVLLGASGAGKSSFLRAGLLPRLARDDRNYLALPVIRPERAVITGDTGLLGSLDAAFAARGLAMPRADIRKAIETGPEPVRALLARLAEEARRVLAVADTEAKTPLLVLSIDQGEELFLPDGTAESERLLTLLSGLLSDDAPAVLVLVTIRSDAYPQLQTAAPIESIVQKTMSLPPMPRGAYQAIIEGPVARLKQTDRPLTIEPALIQALLSDIEKDGGRDALPLLAFTLERLYLEYGARGRLTLGDYEALGRVKGSIEAAVDRALRAADRDTRVPRDRETRLSLLRRGLIPWLAGIDPETGNPRRRVARVSDIPPESLPLIEHLVEQRLIASDMREGTGEVILEPAHEALLRQWELLQNWLKEDAALLNVTDGVTRAAREWDENGRSPIWLTHKTGRLEFAEGLREHPDIAAILGQREWDYLRACRRAEQRTKRREYLSRVAIYAMLVGIIAGMGAWINQAAIKDEYNWLFVMRPFKQRAVSPYVMSAAAEHAKKPGEAFRECALTLCPEMVVIPAGRFAMGSPDQEQARRPDEGPVHVVTIGRRFAVSRYLVTYEEWNVCVSVGGCPAVSMSGFQGAKLPVVNITWHDAQRYVAWLSQMTGQPYRLLSEAEWEYAARAGTTTRYFFGDDERDLPDYAWYAANSKS